MTDLSAILSRVAELNSGGRLRDASMLLALAMGESKVECERASAKVEQAEAALKLFESNERTLGQSVPGAVA